MLGQPSPARSLIQTKLTVNAPGDKYEREADRVADEVMRKPAIRRAVSEDEDETPEVMAMTQASSAAGGAFEAGEAFEQQLHAARGQGEPLPPSLKEDFETRFGADFSRVRIHTDAQSSRLNRSIGAQAFTTGQNIFFRQGAYVPGSTSGQRLIAHELTHSLQQSHDGATRIQRDVGFEFETDWGIHGGDDPKKKSDPPLRKHHSYKDYEGFEVQVDEASRKINKDYPEVEYEIEFVVKHHPETKEGGERLYRTMVKLLEVVRELEEKGRKYALGFMLREPEEKLWVFPEAKDTAKPGQIQARAQATIGLTLAGVQKYGTVEEAKLQERYKEKGFSVVHRSATLGTNRGDFTNIAQKVEETVKDKDLRGLVTLLAFYVRMFHFPTAKKADYAKAVPPILAKTNFAFMFSHLGKKEREKYSNDPDGFADLILSVVNDTRGNLPTISKTEPVISTEVVDEGKLDKAKDLTLETWLKGIPNGKDELTEQYYEELFGFGNLGGTETEVGKGEKVDLAKGKPAMVLEFRAGAPSGFLPPDKWWDFAYDYFHLVRRLHGSEDF
jgi:hypothetical protein